MRAKSVWIRITANNDLGGYEVFEATAKLPEPTWPDLSFDDLLAIAFRGRIITDPDHPVVLEMLGGV
jgi:hypothetical protein